MGVQGASGCQPLGLGIWDLGFAQTQVVARRETKEPLTEKTAEMMQWKQADSTPGDPWTLSQGDARMQGGGGEQSRRIRLQRAETRRRKGGGRQLVERCTADVCDGLPNQRSRSSRYRQPGESTSDRLRKTLAAV
jgi:hypothetical protein